MSSSLYLALTGARALVSKSAAFQGRFGGTEAQALQRIYGDDAEQNLTPGKTLANLRPFAVVCADAHGYVQIGEGSRITLGGTGGILVLLSDNPRTPENHTESYFDFCNWIGQVMDDISELPGRNTYWPFNRIDMVADPLRPPLTSRADDDYWLAGYLFSHHINGGG